MVDVRDCVCGSSDYNRNRTVEENLPCIVCHSCGRECVAKSVVELENNWDMQLDLSTGPEKKTGWVEISRLDNVYFGRTIFCLTSWGRPCLATYRDLNGRTEWSLYPPQEYRTDMSKEIALYALPLPPTPPFRRGETP